MFSPPSSNQECYVLRTVYCVLFFKLKINKYHQVGLPCPYWGGCSSPLCMAAMLRWPSVVFLLVLFFFGECWNDRGSSKNKSTLIVQKNVLTDCTECPGRLHSRAPKEPGSWVQSHQRHPCWGGSSHHHHQHHHHTSTMTIATIIIH